MKKRILLVSLAVTLTGLALFALVSTFVYHDTLVSDAKRYLSVYMLSYEKNADKYAAPYTDESARALSEETGGARVTFLDLDGNVLADSSGAEAFDNHAGREEVASALSSGEGFAVRSSKTLGEDLIYYCKKFASRNLLVRIAVPGASVWAIMGSMVPLFVLFLIADAAVCVALSGLSVRLILRPVERFAAEARESEGAVVAPYRELDEIADTLTRIKRDGREREERIRRERLKEKVILDNMEHGIVILRGPSEVLLINKSAAALLEYDEPQRCAAGLATDRELCEMILGREAGLVYREMGGKEYAVRVAEAGDLDAAVVLITDVTAIRRAERSKNEFIGNVTHEMNTPLTSISGFAELLSAGRIKPEKIPSAAEVILKESERLKNLVKSILNYSAIEDDTLPSYEVDLSAAASEAADAYEAVAETRGVTLSRDILPGVRVYSRAERIREILGNLLSNAVRYNRAGGSVTVTVSREEGVPYLRVSDTGIGIEPEHLGRVFDRFYTVDPSHGGEGGGFGLGLAIVKRLVGKAGWRISLDSTPGEGTAFRIDFLPEKGD